MKISIFCKTKMGKRPSSGDEGIMGGARVRGGGLRGQRDLLCVYLAHQTSFLTCQPSFVLKREIDIKIER